mgnify:CR=1 FL=1|jgi:heptosyltransferase-2
MIVKKILIFNPAFLGDAILVTPLLKICKDYFNSPVIHFCIRGGYEKLFEGLSFIDKIIPFYKRGKDKGIKGIISFSKYLREESYDIIICTHRSIRSILIVHLAKSQLTVGFKNATLSFLLNKKIVRDLHGHEVYRNISLLRPLMGKDYDYVIKNIHSLYVAKNKEYFIKFKYFINAIKGTMKIAGIQATSNWKTKMWPLNRFADLINKLYKRNILSIIFSSPSEIDIIQEMSSFIKVPFISLAGILELDELSSAINNLDLFITNDTGPMHIAAAYKIPIIAIFGPTIPKFGFTPFGCTYNIIEDTTLKCRPCSLHGGAKCPEKHFKCMLNVSVNAVLENAIRIINK